MVAKASDINSSILLLTDSIFAQQASLDLKTSGYQPVVEEIQQGWRKLSLYKPIMVIIDRELTGKLGFHLCRQLRNMGE